MNRLLLLSLLVVTFALPGVAQSAWDIRNFGAVADGQTVNTSAIQAAIDASHEAGGGEVLVSGGEFVTGTILLKDGVFLRVDQDAALLASDNPLHYRNIDPFVDATGQTRGKCLIGAVDATRVGIVGSGTIDGRGGNYQPDALRENLTRHGIDASRFKELAGDRPFLVRFVRSREIKLEDIHLRQPAAWTCHLYQCEQIVIRGINIYSHAHRNNDAIDLDSSSHALIENCVIDSQDDAICFKSTSPVPTHDVIVRNNTIKSGWGAVKFGTEAMGDFYNILVEDCHIHDTRGGGIKILSVDGANIHDVTLRNLVMHNVDMPIFIRLGERRRTYRDAPAQPVGSITDITISGIRATTRASADSRVTPPAGIFITGTPDHPIGLITLRDLVITLPGEGTAEHAAAVVPEDETRYPEFSFFGVLPAYGLYARHVEQLVTDQVSFVLSTPDARPERRIDR